MIASLWIGCFRESRPISENPWLPRSSSMLIESPGFLGYGPYSGAFETDPQGPASNAIGVRVIRGGAWDGFETDCRSARRGTEGVSPFIHDFILGFRAVLSTN